MSMTKKSERDEATKVAAEVSELKAEGYRLWKLKSSRLWQAVAVLAVATVVMIAPVPWGATGVVLTVVFWVVGLGLFVDSIRLRFKAENLNEQIGRLDPSERLLTSLAEEDGRRLKALLEAKKAKS